MQKIDISKYNLKCMDCGNEVPEDAYYVECPACRGLLEVNLLMPLSDRQVRYSLPSIFKFQDFMSYEYAECFADAEDASFTPEFHDPVISEYVGAKVIIKDETCLPTGTWKDREGFISIYRLLLNGIDDLMVFSSGNTGTALARSASRIQKPRLHMVIPEASKKRLNKLNKFYNEDFVKVNFFDGSNDECIQEASRIAADNGFQIEGGFANYARREGLKLLALEHIFYGNEKIDWYAQPIAGGIGVYSYDKAARDTGTETPKILGVQAGICNPMVRAWREQAEDLQSHHIPESVVPSDFVRVLRTRNPGGAYRVLKKVMDKCDGAFTDVTDQQIYDGLRAFYHSDYFKEKYAQSSVLVGLEPATVLAGVKRAVEDKQISPNETVMLNVSGAAKDGDIQQHWIEDLL